LDTTVFKDKIAHLVQPDDSSCKWNLHEAPSDQYFNEFCAEHKVLKRDRKRGTAYEVWEPIRTHAPNHYWDAEIYAMAAAEMFGVYTFKDENIPVPARESDRQDLEDKRSWMPRRSNWIRR